MNSKIVQREKIKLNDSQTKMIISGWGKDVIEKTIVEKITYLSDSLKVKGYIAYPKDNSKKYPCIIWNRGGAKENGAIDRFTATGVFGQIASWGYVVFATQYRGNDGGEGKEEMGGSDLNDILNLISLTEEIPQADKTIWGIEGWSRGGMMTYLTLRKKPIFKCAIVAGAITDLKQLFAENTRISKNFKELVGAENYEAEIKNRSAVNFVHELPKIPYLILHGGADDTVSPLQSIEMAKKFYLEGVNYRLVIFEGAGHFLRTHKKEVDELRRKWFQAYLK